MSLPYASLRGLLLVDAATCAAMGGLLTLAAGPLARAMEIPSALLFWAGLVLFPIAAFMATAARRRSVHPTAAWVVIGGNGLWVAGSLLLLAPGVATPNRLGFAFILGQAVVVAALAALEHRALQAGTFRTTT